MPLMGSGISSIAVKAGTGTTLTSLTMWTAAARKRSLLLVHLVPWPIAPVQSGQDRRRASTYRGVLWGRYAPDTGVGRMLHRTGAMPNFGEHPFHALR